MTLVGEGRVLRVQAVHLVLAVSGVSRAVLLSVVGVVRRLAVVVLVVVASAPAAPATASRPGRVLVGAGVPCLLAGIPGNTHQPCRRGYERF